MVGVKAELCQTMPPGEYEESPGYATVMRRGKQALKCGDHTLLNWERASELARPLEPGECTALYLKQVLEVPSSHLLHFANIASESSDGISPKRWHSAKSSGMTLSSVSVYPG